LQATPLQAGFSDPNRFWLQRSKIEDEDEFEDENELKGPHTGGKSARRPCTRPRIRLAWRLKEVHNKFSRNDVCPVI